MAEDSADSYSYSSYLWYTAVWYLLQFLIISALRFFISGKFDKKSLQQSAADTLLLSSVFLLLQWSESLLSRGIYRLPYVLVHLCVDLIPTMAWLVASELVMLISLATAQKLYHSLANGGKASAKNVKENMGSKYLKSISSHQHKLEQASQSHIKDMFPRLVEKSQQVGQSSPGLSIVFGVVFFLLQLSTIGFVLLNTTIEVVKTSYKKISTQKLKELKPAALELGQLALVSLISSIIVQYKFVTMLLAEATRLLKTSSGDKSKPLKGKGDDSSPSANKGSSKERPHTLLVNESVSNSNGNTPIRHHDD